jgi:WD40 repeat protein
MTPGEQPHLALTAILDRYAESQQPFVLFIDQFEEVFTLCQDETERSNFMRRMASTASHPEGITRVIVAIRGDFLDRCASYPEPARLINQTHPSSYVVQPLSLAELEAAIEQPALCNGVSFEPGLVSQIAADVIDRPGALPLLQYALLKLWQICITDTADLQPLLTRQGYEQIGGVRGALDQRASALYRDFAPADQAFVHRLFMELVQLGDQQEVTRRRASWHRIRAIADSDEQLDRVIRVLASQQQRLIVTNAETVEVAHEALLTEWTLPRKWIAEDRESIRLSRTLEGNCRDWQDRYQQSDDALLSGAQLATIAEWIDRTRPKLTQTEAEFVRRSLEKRDRQLQAQLEQERKLREEAEARAMAEIEKAIEAERRAEAEAGRAIEAKRRVKAEKRRTQVVALAGGLVTMLAVVTVWFGMKAEQQTALAVQASLSESQRFIESDNQLAAMLSIIRTLNMLDGRDAQNSKTLTTLQSISAQVHEFNHLQGHSAQTSGISFDPKGELVVAASADGTVKLWNVDGEPQNTPSGSSAHGDIVWDVAFSPNGETIASVGSDPSVKLWNRSGELLHSLPHFHDVHGLSFSPDSSRVVSGDWHGVLKLWNVRTGQLIKAHDERESYPPRSILYIYSASFNPSNPTQIAYSGYFGTSGGLKIWDTETNTVKSFGQHQNIVSAISYSSDGSLLAAANLGGVVEFWDSSSGKLLGRVESELNAINDIAFSSNHQWLAVAGANGTVTLWNVEEALQLWRQNRTLRTPNQIFEGHDGAVNGVAFSPNDKIIASTSDDRTIRFWQINVDVPEGDSKELFARNCHFLADFLRTNSTLSEADRQLCRNIPH